MRPRLTYANVMATIAVFLALGGASYAAFKLPKNSVGTKQLKNNAVTTKKIKKQAITAAKVKKKTLTGQQINVAKLGTVPAANTADVANTANSVAPSEGWHEIGTPGEPYFENSWHNNTSGKTFETAGFYKDHEGVVHLKGHVLGGTSFTIFHLPPGYRPASGKALFILASCGGGPCSTSGVGSIGIAGSGTPDAGEVLVLPGVTSVTFDGISFRAES
jgi:hypothetical protein